MTDEEKKKPKKPAGTALTRQHVDRVFDEHLKHWERRLYSYKETGVVNAIRAAELRIKLLKQLRKELLDGADINLEV